MFVVALGYLTWGTIRVGEEEYCLKERDVLQMSVIHGHMHISQPTTQGYLLLVKRSHIKPGNSWEEKYRTACKGRDELKRRNAQLEKDLAAARNSLVTHQRRHGGAMEKAKKAVTNSTTKKTDLQQKNKHLRSEHNELRTEHEQLKKQQQDMPPTTMTTEGAAHAETTAQGNVTQQRRFYSNFNTVFLLCLSCCLLLV